jgi:hypothetical protein
MFQQSLNFTSLLAEAEHRIKIHIFFILNFSGSLLSKRKRLSEIYNQSFWKDHLKNKKKKRNFYCKNFFITSLDELKDFFSQTKRSF